MSQHIYFPFCYFFFFLATLQEKAALKTKSIWKKEIMQLKINCKELSRIQNHYSEKQSFTGAKSAVLKHFTKFTGTILSWSPLLVHLIPCNFTEKYYIAEAFLNILQNLKKKALAQRASRRLLLCKAMYPLNVPLNLFKKLL